MNAARLLSFRRSRVYVVAAVAGVVGSWAIAWWGTRIRIPPYPCSDSRRVAAAAASAAAWNHAGRYMDAAIWVSLALGVAVPFAGAFAVRRTGEWDRERLWLVAFADLVATGLLWLGQDRLLHQPPCEGL